MTDELKYPSRYEIEQSLTEFCRRGFVEDFLQNRGVFITHATQSDLAEFISGLLLEHGELEQIRNAALQVHSRSTLAGFLVTCEDETFSLVDLLDSWRGKVVDQKANMKLGALTSSKQAGNELHQGQVEYTQRRPGRVQFLQGTERSFDYYVRQEKKRVWRVLIDCDRSNDARLMEDWLNGAMPRGSDVVTIDQSQLTTSQTVAFFDELARQGTQRNWTFTQVKHLVLRRATNENTDEDDDNENANDTSDSVQADHVTLSGISQAILEGDDLRNNAFVRECEKGGYRFSAMTYEYEHREHAYMMQVRAEFKRKPKVFEVAIESYKRRTGLEERLEDATLPKPQSIELLSQFWAAARRVYTDLAAETV
jgi:hypothetical protein